MTTFFAYLLIWIFPIIVVGGLMWMAHRNRSEPSTSPPTGSEPPSTQMPGTTEFDRFRHP